MKANLSVFTFYLKVAYVVTKGHLLWCAVHKNLILVVADCVWDSNAILTKITAVQIELHKMNDNPYY